MTDPARLRTVTATRYVTPLREGGSLPAIVEADDDGLYVLKFRGAGQGEKALIAELAAGELARAAGLPVPEIVFMQLDGELARTEPDAEIQDLIRASAGLNLALDYLPGALAFDPLAHPVEPDLASDIVWLDAFIGNPDRTARNTNLLVWHRRVWLIDHGASMYFQHAWTDAASAEAGLAAAAGAAFKPVRDHVLLPRATRLPQADARLAERLAPCFEAIVQQIPAAWLSAYPAADAARVRNAYAQVLTRRLQAPRHFVEEAQRAHAAHV
jgi:hypothetical protein